MAFGLVSTRMQGVEQATVGITRQTGQPLDDDWYTDIDEHLLCQAETSDFQEPYVTTFVTSARRDEAQKND